MSNRKTNPRSTRTGFPRPSIVACLGMLLTFGNLALGQEASIRQQASPAKPAPALNWIVLNNIEDWILQGRGIPDDWSHRHFVFSNPGTEEEAFANGTHDRWLNIVNDPRFILQQMKRGGDPKVLEADGNPLEGKVPLSTRKSKIDRDWSKGILTGTVQPNTYPAKFSFSTTTASCSSDFVVYPTGTAGTSTTASIVALYNLYTTGCGGTVPSIHWAYNTGGTVTTSPILSYDSTGSQVAFIQVTGTTASLVILKWAASTTESATAPDTLTVQGSASLYRSCTAPCFYSVSLGADDTFSSPFYDYGGDALYVGDDSGRLHKITGVFNGTTIAEASGWPVTLTSGNKVSSPIYDPASGYVFEGDSEGILYSVTASTGTVHGNTGSLGDIIIDAPLVDGSVGSVNAFVTTSASGKPYAGGNVVVQFSTAFTAYGSPGTVYVGAGGSGYYLYEGSFDNVYYQSTSHTGNLYVVGNTGATTGASLYQVVISGGFFTGTVNTAASGLNSNEHPWPSPATEFCNPGTNSGCALNSGQTATSTGTDYLFFSVNRGAKTGCINAAGDGCILSYNISNPTAVVISGSGLNVVTPATNGCWATGGIVIDNGVPLGSMAGASQVYFIGLAGNASGGPTGTTKTSSNCTTGTGNTILATQASQSSP
jgi:hypothetical protein